MSQTPGLICSHKTYSRLRVKRHKYGSAISEEGVGKKIYSGLCMAKPPHSFRMSKRLWPCRLFSAFEALNQENFLGRENKYTDQRVWVWFYGPPQSWGKNRYLRDQKDLPAGDCFVFPTEVDAESIQTFPAALGPTQYFSETNPDSFFNTKNGVRWIQGLIFAMALDNYAIDKKLQASHISQDSPDLAKVNPIHLQIADFPVDVLASLNDSYITGFFRNEHNNVRDTCVCLLVDRILLAIKALLNHRSIGARMDKEMNSTPEAPIYVSSSESEKDSHDTPGKAQTRRSARVSALQSGSEGSPQPKVNVGKDDSQSLEDTEKQLSVPKKSMKSSLTSDKAQVTPTQENGPSVAEGKDNQSVKRSKRVIQNKEAQRFTPDPEKLAYTQQVQEKLAYKQQVQRLLQLRHASQCPIQSPQQCQSMEACARMKKLWKHISNCKDRQCQTSHCVSSRLLNSHYHRCKEDKCPVCSPIREAIKREQANSKAAPAHELQLGVSSEAKQLDEEEQENLQPRKDPISNNLFGAFENLVDNSHQQAKKGPRSIIETKKQTSPSKTHEPSKLSKVSQDKSLHGCASSSDSGSSGRKKKRGRPPRLLQDRDGDSPKSSDSSNSSDSPTSSYGSAKELLQPLVDLADLAAKDNLSNQTALEQYKATKKNSGKLSDIERKQGKKKVRKMGTGKKISKENNEKVISQSKPIDHNLPGISNLVNQVSETDPRKKLKVNRKRGTSDSGVLYEESAEQQGPALKRVKSDNTAPDLVQQRENRTSNVPIALSNKMEAGGSALSQVYIPGCPPPRISSAATAAVAAQAQARAQAQQDLGRSWDWQFPPELPRLEGLLSDIVRRVSIRSQIRAAELCSNLQVIEMARKTNHTRSLSKMEVEDREEVNKLLRRLNLRLRVFMKAKRTDLLQTLNARRVKATALEQELKERASAQVSHDTQLAELTQATAGHAKLLNADSSSQILQEIYQHYEKYRKEKSDATEAYKAVTRAKESELEKTKTHMAWTEEELNNIVSAEEEWVQYKDKVKAQFAAPPATLLLSDDRCLAHRGMLQEIPARLGWVDNVARELSVKHLDQVDPIILEYVQQTEFLLHVHSAKYLERLKETSEQARAVGKGVALNPSDKDTVVGPNSWEAATVAVALVLEATHKVLTGEGTNAFCAVRPPGHHAGITPNDKDGNGFCLLNNAAAGALYALKEQLAEKVVIFDFDVHHGNGTEEIVAQLKRDDILFISLHAKDEYPGTGLKSPHGNVLNLGIPKLFSFDDVDWNHIKEKIDNFGPDLFILSAGFDAHEKDPMKLAKFQEEDFGSLVTDHIAELAACYADGAIVSVLEGGYASGPLAASVRAHIAALADDL